MFFNYKIIRRKLVDFDLFPELTPWLIGLQEEAEIDEKKKKKEKEDSMHAMKSAIIISGIVVALAGAVLAIAKKPREK